MTRSLALYLWPAIPNLSTLVSYLQTDGESGRGHVQLRASMTVKGMVTAKRRSESARLKMKMFLAVLMTALRRTASITIRFPTTGEKQVSWRCGFVTGGNCIFVRS